MGQEIALVVVGAAVIGGIGYLIYKSTQPTAPVAQTGMQTYQIPGAPGGTTTVSSDPSTGYSAVDYVAH
jgi:hypothetical protein